MTSAPTPELALLVRCVQATADPTCRAEWPRVDAGIDWRRVFHTCRTHGLLAFVARAMLEAGKSDDVPAGARTALRTALVLGQRQARWPVPLFHDLATRLASGGVRVVPLKGAALSLSLYGTMPLRQMSDIDVLVRSEDLALTHALLHSMDLVPSNARTSRLHWHAAIGNHVKGRASYDDGLRRIDVHWRPRYYIDEETVTLDWAALWSRLARHPTPRGDVWVLDPSDHLVFLLTHALERWSPSLTQLLDVSLSLRALPRDWLARTAPAAAALPESVRSAADRLVAACREAFLSEARPDDWSPGTREVVADFVERRRGPAFTRAAPQDGFWRRLLHLPPSYRLAFVAGFFVPNPTFTPYRSLDVVERCRAHAAWMRDRAIARALRR